MMDYQINFINAYNNPREKDGNYYMLFLDGFYLIDGPLYNTIATMAKDNSFGPVRYGVSSHSLPISVPRMETWYTQWVMVNSQRIPIFYTEWRHIPGI